MKENIESAETQFIEFASLLKLLSPSSKEKMNILVNNNPSLVTFSKKRLFSEESSSPEHKKIKVDSKPKKIIEKPLLVKYVENTTSIPLTDKVLVDINPIEKQNSKFIHLGREKVPGSKTQMRHVIPCALTANLIETVSVLEPSKTVIINFAKLFRLLFKDKEGYCFSSKTLNEPSYKELAPIVIKEAKKIIRSENADSFLISPNKIKDHTFTPTKKDKGISEFKELNIKYIELAIYNLANSIDDSNTTVLAIETLSRLLLGYVNTESGVAFPEEGNTQNFEIRLYATKEKAKKGKDTYKLVSAKELKTLEEEAVKTKTESVTERVRIVDCEGPNIVKIEKALKALSEIVGNYFIAQSATTQLETYNKIGHLQLVLANDNSAIAEYNEKLTEKNYFTKACYHLAKLIYFAFDFKALEETVLIPSNTKGDKNVLIYKNATIKSPAEFKFSDGIEFRQNSINEVKKTKKYTKSVKFREEKTDLDFLEKKLIANFITCTLPYLPFTRGFNNEDNFLDNALVALIKLVSIDYGLKQPEEEELLTQARIDYLDLTLDKHPQINLTNSQIELKIEGHDFSDILGGQVLLDNDTF